MYSANQQVDTYIYVMNARYLCRRTNLSSNEFHV